MKSRSDELDRWARSYRREPIPEAREKSVDGRRFEDGSGPSRRPWGATGRRGVYRLPSGRYEAKLRVAGRLVRLGTFDTIDEAAATIAERGLRDA